jgi:hypothetical protein
MEFQNRRLASERGRVGGRFARRLASGGVAKDLTSINEPVFEAQIHGLEQVFPGRRRPVVIPPVEDF